MKVYPSQRGARHVSVTSPARVTFEHEGYTISCSNIMSPEIRIFKDDVDVTDKILDANEQHLFPSARNVVRCVEAIEAFLDV